MLIPGQKSSVTCALFYSCKLLMVIYTKSLTREFILICFKSTQNKETSLSQWNWNCINHCFIKDTWNLVSISQLVKISLSYHYTPSNSPADFRSEDLSPWTQIFSLGYNKSYWCQMIFHFLHVRTDRQIHLGISIQLEPIGGSRRKYQNHIQIC